MSQAIEKIFRNYFRLYFILCLLGFTLAILLMSIPRLLAAEKTALPSKSFLTSHASEKTSDFNSENLKKFFRWNLTNAKSQVGDQETYMEFVGNRMLLKVRF